ncbi:MAG TPA: NUDIX domain-containing protein [Stenomitos sp.]
MKFKNTPNHCLNVEGKEYWISRSATVLGLLMVALEDQVYVPLGLRGEDMPDETDKWGLPGGYVDYDETVGEALVREVWEELGLNLLALQVTHSLKGSLEQPYYVFSEPIRRQNITLRFPVLFLLAPGFDLPDLRPQVSHGEVKEARWFPLETALKMNLAFNHQDALQHCLDHYYNCSCPSMLRDRTA